jgi:hypothetical protein
LHLDPFNDDDAISFLGDRVGAEEVQSIVDDFHSRRFPGGGAVDEVIGTCFCKASGADRFGYWHRRIGEYLGARWLANLADTDRRRRRVLSLFQAHGLVPASLRCMHAWLAQYSAFTSQVIAGDPTGLSNMRTSTT